MKKIWKYSVLMAGVLAAAVAVQQLAQEPSCGVAYRVTGGKNEMILLGSIHVGSRDMYPMCSAIRDAIKRADTLVFECDTTSPQAQAVTASMMQSEEPLSARISSECYARLQMAAEKLGYSMQTFEHLDPWAVTSTLTVAAAAQEMNAGNARTASAYGVENMVRRQAAAKKIAYLETAEAQLDLMEHFSPALQEYLLASACQAVLEPNQLTGMDQDMDQWPEWWKEGNAQAFADSYTKGLAQEASPELVQEYHEALMTARNRQMAAELLEMLQSEENHSYVVTVGLMHLVLPGDSIADHLRDSGYSVEQIIQ